MFGVGRANQGKVSFIRYGKDDATVGPLKEIAFVMVKQFFGHDMAAPNQSHRILGNLTYRGTQDVSNPRPACIDQRAGQMDLSVICRDLPNVTLALGACDFGMSKDVCSANLRRGRSGPPVGRPRPNNQSIHTL
jgi:hypothetical protein